MRVFEAANPQNPTTPTRTTKEQSAGGVRGAEVLACQGVYEEMHLVGGSPVTERLIHGVVVELPEEVRAFVWKSVCFMAVGSAQGFGHAIRKQELFARVGGYGEPADWIVNLGEDGVTAQVVAHEIAHAYLGHGHGHGIEDEEEEADRVAAEWGFQRLDDSDENRPS